MHAAAELPVRERLQHWIEHLTHILPAQAPIREFVHHNTLHGFQHLPFADALASVHALTGARMYWPEKRFRAAYAAGRIDAGDLQAAFAELGLSGLDEEIAAGCTRRDVLLASLLTPAEAPTASRQGWLTREGMRDDLLFARATALTAGAAGTATGEDWPAVARQRWLALCARVGKEWTLRSLLHYLSGEDVLETVRSMLQRQLAAHLDLGVVAWRNPARGLGFFAAWRASVACDAFWEISDLHSIRDEIAHLPDDPVEVLLAELAKQLPDEAQWPGYLERLALEQPGWSGMFLWRDRHPGFGDGTGIDMVDYLAVRMLLERLLCEDLLRQLTGSAMEFDELQGYYLAEAAEFYVRDALRRGGLDEALQHAAGRLLLANEQAAVDEKKWAEMAAQIAAARPAEISSAWRLAGLLRQLALPPAALDSLTPAAAQHLLVVAAELSDAERGQLWLLAYERHYREQLFAGLRANQYRHFPIAAPSAQVVMCMDDREEGTRRHLEEIAPDIMTYGAAGFFGVPMWWQGLDDPEKSALCPVVVQPTHLVRETVRPAAAGGLARHVAQRESRLRWRERLYQATRRRALGGPLLTALAGVPALAALTATTLAPGWFGAAVKRWRTWFEGRLPTQLALTAEEASAGTPAQPQAGFTDLEQVDRVEAFLRMIGLTDNFAPLVLMFGHGSGSRNNPHYSAYACGACSGKHGGANARVFASMANRPAVRAGLAARGLSIPDTCWFVAAEHNTCDDGVEWYDLDTVPAAFQPALETLVRQVGEACRAHAAERCRRLASAPQRPNPWLALRHMRGRANDISQARPELGHATNAAAFIGRRTMSRGLFLDRRVFLISYDPVGDDTGEIVEGILLAAGPVGAGISLEYYFSTVNNDVFGCGSKITHNITGLFGVMEGADSDLRTGLPLQMVEIHEPMRLLVVVEQTPAVLTAILHRQPALQELIGNAWVVLAACDPLTGALEQYCPRRGWLPWSGGGALPQVARSADWFAGESEPLAPAIILGAA